MLVVTCSVYIKRMKSWNGTYSSWLTLHGCSGLFRVTTVKMFESTKIICFYNIFFFGWGNVECIRPFHQFGIQSFPIQVVGESCRDIKRRHFRCGVWDLMILWFDVISFVWWWRTECEDVLPQGECCNLYYCCGVVVEGETAGLVQALFLFFSYQPELLVRKIDNWWIRHVGRIMVKLLWNFNYHWFWCWLH